MAFCFLKVIYQISVEYVYKNAKFSVIIPTVGDISCSLSCLTVLEYVLCQVCIMLA